MPAQPPFPRQTGSPKKEAKQPIADMLADLLARRKKDEEELARLREEGPDFGESFLTALGAYVPGAALAASQTKRQRKLSEIEGRLNEDGDFLRSLLPGALQAELVTEENRRQETRDDAKAGERRDRAVKVFGEEGATKLEFGIKPEPTEKEIRAKAVAEREGEIDALTVIFGGDRETARSHFQRQAKLELDLIQSEIEANNSSGLGGGSGAGGGDGKPMFNHPTLGPVPMGQGLIDRLSEPYFYRAGMFGDAADPTNAGERMLARSRFDTKADWNAKAFGALRNVALRSGRISEKQLNMEFGAEAFDADPFGTLERASSAIGMEPGEFRRAFNAEILRSNGVHTASQFSSELAFGLLSGTLNPNDIEEAISLYTESELVDQSPVGYIAKDGRRLVNTEAIQRALNDPETGGIIQTIRAHIERYKMPLSRSEAEQDPRHFAVLSFVRSKLEAALTDPTPLADPIDAAIDEVSKKDAGRNPDPLRNLPVKVRAEQFAKRADPGPFFTMFGASRSDFIYQAVVGAIRNGEFKLEDFPADVQELVRKRGGVK